MRISDWSSDVCSSDLCSLISIGEEILRWEQPLPIVSHHHPLGRQHATPGIGSTVKTTSRRIFPFRLGRQFLPCPSGIGMGILVSAMNDRMAEQSVDGTVGAGRMPPVCAKTEGPPLQRIILENGHTELREQRTTRNQQI